MRIILVFMQTMSEQTISLEPYTDRRFEFERPADDHHSADGVTLEVWNPSPDTPGMIRVMRQNSSGAGILEEAYHGFRNAMGTMRDLGSVGLGGIVTELGIAVQSTEDEYMKSRSGLYLDAEQFTVAANNLAIRLDVGEPKAGARFGVFDGGFYDAFEFTKALADKGEVLISNSNGVFHDQYAHSVGWLMVPGDVYGQLRAFAAKLHEDYITSPEAAVLARREMSRFMRLCDRGIRTYDVYLSLRERYGAESFARSMLDILGLSEGLELEQLEKQLLRRIDAAKQLSQPDLLAAA